MEALNVQNGLLSYKKKFISFLFVIALSLILMPEVYAGANAETSTLKKGIFKGRKVSSREPCHKILNHFGQKIVLHRDWNAIDTTQKIVKKLKAVSIHAREKGKATLLFADSRKDRSRIAAEVIATATASKGLYRIDLSTVASKYIGETEKNLSRIFETAETCGVVLLFDEADALFGKRTKKNDKRERFRNAEINHLLECIERFQGLVILATNNGKNLNKKYIRMFYFLDFDSGKQKTKSKRIYNKPKAFKKGTQGNNAR